jgi:hypothetical protein
MRQLYPLLFAVLPFAACNINRHNVSYNFKEKAAQHKKMAILPAQVMYTGFKPRLMDNKTYIHTVTSDAYLMQQSMYGALLRRTYIRSKNRRLRMDIQPPDETNRLLTLNGVTAATQLSYDSLARLLGVDALLSASVVKDRMASEGLSFATDLTLVAASALAKDSSGRRNTGYMPTYGIYTTYMIIDGKDARPVWNFEAGGDADWFTTPNMITERNNEAMAKFVPYRRADARLR